MSGAAWTRASSLSLSSSAGLNGSSAVVTLSGFQQLSAHRLLLLPLFLLLWAFVVLSDSLLISVVLSRPSLRRPMFLFIAALLSNSLLGSLVVYPRLLWDLSRPGPVSLSRSSCLAQAFFLHAVGCSSFLLLASMALDRFLSVARPLRYAAIMSPRLICGLLLLSWLCPVLLVGTAAVLAGGLPLCSSAVARVYCDTYTLVSLSCAGPRARLSDAFGLLVSVLLVLLPALFVVFSYGRILFVCLVKSRAFSRKALRTCGPHVAVFLNYALCVALELLQRRSQDVERSPAALSLSVAVSILVLFIPTVCNPLVYGFKVTEIYRQICRLLRG